MQRLGWRVDPSGPNAAAALPALTKQVRQADTGQVGAPTWHLSKGPRRGRGEGTGLSDTPERQRLPAAEPGGGGGAPSLEPTCSSENFRCIAGVKLTGTRKAVLPEPGTQ